ncbi:tetratricopeptide repeat protein [Maricaulis sp.]|uniref:tetratricopeptide repeat protein n=1 Tax=Maricaulis sp. TaxID=1486257 RepID=UPI00262672E0|nr:tetratricopeptide repeat protein [Maricaulis sp.]
MDFLRLIGPVTALVLGAALALAAPSYGQDTNEDGASLFDRGNTARMNDDVEAMREDWTRSCELGFGPACYELARFIQRGTFGEPNIPQALYYYDLACRRLEGDTGRRRMLARACTEAGAIHANGHAGSVNPELAVQRLVTGCGNGNADGCLMLAYTHARGWLGLEVNMASAAEIFGFACTLGNNEGCTTLATLHYNGEGVARDLTQARHLFEDACIRQDASACSAAFQILAETHEVEQTRMALRSFYWNECQSSNRSCTIARMLDQAE